MHRNRFLWIISAILGFVLAFTGCATNKTQSATDNIGLNAEAVSEGISLNFENIPMETTRLFIYFSEHGNAEEITGTHELIVAHSDLRGSLLEQVKETGRVIFPFVKAGQKYTIFATFEKEGFVQIASINFLECTPYSGIYFDNGIELDFNENHTSVTLSSEPNFSTEVNFAPVKYDFSATIENSDGGGLGVSAEEWVNFLSWDFEPQMTNLIKERNHLASGDYSAYITAFCNIIYDNVTWNVEIAKTSVFTYTL
jgi:hypothetical protein